MKTDNVLDLRNCFFNRKNKKNERIGSRYIQLKQEIINKSITGWKKTIFSSNFRIFHRKKKLMIEFNL